MPIIPFPKLSHPNPQTISPTQGAGETLRGTLNATADRRFGYVSLATHAKSEDVINAGCAETQTGRFAHQHEH